VGSIATKKTKSLPRSVDGLGRDRRALEIKLCADCRALKRKFKDEVEVLLKRRAELLEENYVLVAPKLETRCKLHKDSVRRRYGSGIARRRWKQNENKRGFSKKVSKKS
jgi:predicted ATP-grasp superfamily ATP-dependent carboligase